MTVVSHRKFQIPSDMQTEEKSTEKSWKIKAAKYLAWLQISPYFFGSDEAKF